ncbi:hypothetical protein ABZ725_42490 [Streptomyces sp. NPDC006872]|uniref:hypothetical protein n=1 Tax=Streptomyces sp. NPDC006872 TaxID=3155720 RepID=UPI0033E122F3
MTTHHLTVTRRPMTPQSRPSQKRPARHSPTAAGIHSGPTPDTAVAAHGDRRNLLIGLLDRIEEWIHEAGRKVAGFFEGVGDDIDGFVRSL